MNLKTVLTVCSGRAALLASAVTLSCASVAPVFADPLLRQTDLVSDVLSAAINDPSLTNAWGISEGPTTPFWISDNGTGVTTLYSVPGAGSTPVSKVPLTVTIPSGSLATSAPTGQVFNGTASGFNLKNGSKSLFIFDSEDGVISAWNGGLGTNAEIEVNNSNSDPTKNAVYKGLAIDNMGGALFATNFRSGMVEMYKSDSTSQFDLVASFTDPTLLSAGYAPFGAAVLNGKLYVTFALQDSTKHDDVAGAGNGFVDTFDLSGGSMQRLISNGALNSPWGLAIAPSSFGSLAGDLLVGNFGDGTINAYTMDGTFVGALDGLDGSPLAIDGLWALMIGNNAGGGLSNVLYFTAGPGGESEGLFGSLSVPEPSTWAMMLIGFAALGFAGYRRTQKIAAQLHA
jgi:uncharacterized protein (TIGR03118 family)